MSTQFLLLWLEAPLQSWGADSKFGRRDTLNFPTKSGVAGLLLCSLGASGPQTELLSTFAALKQTVISYARTKKTKDDELMKIDREPILRDFHMVGSGYDDKSPWESLLIPRTSEGKKAVGGGAKLTYRYYLQDAKFAVIVEAPSAQVDIFVEGLKSPVYDIYLGRKNCVPTDFVYRDTFESEEAALSGAGDLALAKNLIEDFRVVDGELNESGECMTLNDVPLEFGEIKRYRDRRVTVISK